MKEKKQITKETYSRNVRKFAKEGNEAFDAFESFCSTHCKGKKKLREFTDELAELSDRFRGIDVRMCMWCQKNGINIPEFAEDVMNSNT